MSQTSPKIWVYFFWPLLFLAICWSVWLADFYSVIHFKRGIEPRTYNGLLGILTAPFLHKDFNHLINNSVPFLLLGSSLFFFYKDLAHRVFFWLFIGSGVWLWCLGREGNHIGASTMVYGMFSFVTTGGFVSKNKNLLAIALLTVFAYGSMIWGIFPLPLKESISWEGHLSGLMWGVILALFFQRYLPKKNDYPLNDDNHINEEIFGKDYWKTEEQIAQENSEDSIQN